MSVAQETCRAELANFFAGLSNSKPWWYSIAGSGDWSISKLLRLDALQAHALLLTAGLIKYKGDGFEVKADEWSDFISTYGLHMQVEKTQTPTKLKAWFVLIGSSAKGSQHVAANQYQRLRDAIDAKELAGKRKPAGERKRRKNPLGYDVPRLRLVAESRELSEAISGHIVEEVMVLEKRIGNIINAFNANKNRTGDLGNMSSLFAEADAGGEAAGESTRDGGNEASSEGGGGESGTATNLESAVSGKQKELPTLSSAMQRRCKMSGGERNRRSRNALPMSINQRGRSGKTQLPMKPTQSG